MDIVIAPQKFENELKTELGLRKVKILEERERLFLVEELLTTPFWSQNHCRHIQEIPFQSVKDAQTHLKALGKFWHHHGTIHFRRGELIQSGLPKWKIGKKTPKDPWPSVPLNFFTLKDENTLWASLESDSPFPDGEILFEERTEGPPSRAYLKLWEALYRLQWAPKANAPVLDLGACPGGWTWVLAQAGSKVTAIDRSALADDLMKNPKIKWIKGDAFTAKEKDVGAMTAVFSDVICYPKRLFELIENWRDNTSVELMVLTIKFQGQTDFETLFQLAKIKDSQILHLTANKHELTWIWQKESHQNDS